MRSSVLYVCMLLVMCAVVSIMLAVPKDTFNPTSIQPCDNKEPKKVEAKKDPAMIEEAFVSYCNCGRYEPLVIVLLDSLHLFSTRPIIMYWIGCQPAFNVSQYPRLINEYVPAPPIHVGYAKLKAILLAKVKYAVYIDADNVVNRRIDDLFAMCREHGHEYPLLTRHAQDPDDEKPSMDRLGVATKSMPYGHASTFIYSYKSMPFFMETYELIFDGKFEGQQYTDETALNVMLWKHNVSRQMCVYDMYFYDSSGIYERQDVNMPYGDYVAFGYLGTQTPLAFLTHHGEKVPERAREMFEFFKKHQAKKPYFNGKEWSEDWKTGARGCLCGAEKTCDLYPHHKK